MLLSIRIDVVEIHRRYRAKSADSTGSDNPLYCYIRQITVWFRICCRTGDQRRERRGWGGHGFISSYRTLLSRYPAFSALRIVTTIVLIASLERINPCPTLICGTSKLILFKLFLCLLDGLRFRSAPVKELNKAIRSLVL